MKKNIFILNIILLPFGLLAQSANETSQPINYAEIAIITLGIACVLIGLILVYYLANLYMIIININRAKNGLALTSYSKILLDKYWIGEKNLVAQYEVLPHAYDGISELNNGMPPWLKFIFISTIGFAVVYMSIYYVFEVGAFQEQEYQTELIEAEKSVNEYLAKQANSIDETNVKLLADAKTLDRGKALFTQNCKACHGAEGQGGIGPNLTDNYWLHGGSINEIFKTVKYGIPEKGMISWKQKLKPNDIQDVSNFIVSLKGTTPPNPKSQEGILVQ